MAVIARKKDRSTFGEDEYPIHLSGSTSIPTHRQIAMTALIVACAATIALAIQEPLLQQYPVLMVAMTLVVVAITVRGVNRIANLH